MPAFNRGGVERLRTALRHFLPQPTSLELRAFSLAVRTGIPCMPWGSLEHFFRLVYEAS